LGFIGFGYGTAVGYFVFVGGLRLAIFGFVCVGMDVLCY